MNRRFTSICVSLIITTTGLAAQVERVPSPDGKLVARIKMGNDLQYSVLYQGQSIMTNMPLSLTLDNGTVLGLKSEVSRIERHKTDREIRPVYGVKNAVIRDCFNERIIYFKGSYRLIVRVYDDAVAYRWATDLPGRIRIKAENVTYRFIADAQVLFPEEQSLLTHSERLYQDYKLSTIKPEQFAGLPLLVDLPEGPKVVITEVDLQDYPGLYLRGTEDRALTGLLPAVAVEEEQKSDRTVAVTKRADYLAETEGTRSFPWRVAIVAAKDTDLLENETVYKLAPTCVLKDTSWIKPGKVAWDWWNYNNIFGVDFRAGINTETYKYYIDFASKYGIEYIILDEGWYKLGDLMAITPGMDMEELFRYARQKKVKIILWVVWKTLDDQLHEALDQFQKWGAAGIKVDFMQRDDQWMVNYYERIAREAAKRHLLVDYHGSYSPKGLRRQYPNVITREGVKGLENCKWSADITPAHNCTLPFTRMVAGPMDYTPGAMLNGQGKDYAVRFNRPMSQDTRCHQLAMYVIFESPLQMLADSPSHYLRERECMEFLSVVPSVWDQTIALEGKVGKYVVMARRRGPNWYIGAMTDETARVFTVDLSFLDSGRYEATIFHDGPNADRYAQDYQKAEQTVNASSTLALKLAGGGGWVARLVRKNN